MSTNETALTTVDSELSKMQLSPIADLFKPEIINPILDVIEKHVRSIPVDISTDKGRKECIALAGKVCKSKTFIESSRKKHLEDIQKIVKTVNSSSNASQARLQKLQDDTRKPVTDWEDIEKTRVAALEAELAEITNAGQITGLQWQVLSIESMKDRMHDIDSTATDWQEYGQRAKLAMQTASAQIKVAIAQREKYDAEQFELEQLRTEARERAAKDEDARIEKEAKERAEAYAAQMVKQAEEKAERDRKAESDRASAELLRVENEKRDAEARALQAVEDAKASAVKAESDRLAAEQKAKQDQEAAIQRERERVENANRAEAAAIAAREADKKHRGIIYRDILKVLRGTGLDESTGYKIIELIATGKIPHVSIQF